MKEMNMVKAIHLALTQILEYDQKAFILGEDVGKKGGVFRATEGLQQLYGEKRVLDTPLTEAMIVGTAIGASLYGYHPIAEIQFVDFILPAVNQIISEAAKMRYRSQGDWTCPLVIRAPYGAGVHGGLYHSQSFESLFANVPGLRIVIPSDPQDAKDLLQGCLANPDPVLFFEPKKAYRLVSGPVDTSVDSYKKVNIGQAAVKKPGEDLSIITYGICTYYALEVAKQLEEQGLSIEVLDLRSIYPLDQQAIIKTVKKTGKALLVCEANQEGSVIGEVAAIIAEHCFFDLDAPVMRLASADIPLMPFHQHLEAHILVDQEKIKQAAVQLGGF